MKRFILTMVAMLPLLVPSAYADDTPPLSELEQMRTDVLALSREELAAKYCPETGFRPYPKDWWLGGGYIYPAWVAVNLGFAQTVGCLDVGEPGEKYSGTQAKNIAFAAGSIKALFGGEVAHSPYEYERRAMGGDRAIYVGAFSNDSIFEIVGVSGNPRDLIGDEVLVAYCHQPGDITEPGNWPTATPTDTLRALLREMFPGTRLYCLPSGMNKEDESEYTEKGANTIYMKPLPSSGKRMKELIAGNIGYVGVDYTTALALKRLHGFQETISWKAFPRKVSMLLAANRDDPDMDQHYAFMAATRAAMQYVLSDVEAEIARVTELAIDPNVQTPFGRLAPPLSNEIGSEERLAITTELVRESFRIGIQEGTWSLSGCISRTALAEYLRIMTHNQVTAEEITDPSALCPL